jgi:hypothetical protein
MRSGPSLGLGGRFGCAVAQAGHDQRVGQARDPEADAAFRASLLPLRFQREAGDVDRVVHHAHGDAHEPASSSSAMRALGVNGRRTSRARLIEPSRQAP